MNLCILSLSASEKSVGRVCAQVLRNIWLAAGHRVELIDIRSLPPVWVDNRGLAALPQPYAEVDAAIRSAEGVVLVYPVYCYTASSPAKAITEVFGAAFERMPVAMVVAAGSVRSHLAVGDLMQSMMFEQGTICFPKTVMATSADLDGACPRCELDLRLRELSSEFVWFAQALSTYRQLAVSKA